MTLKANKKDIRVDPHRYPLSAIRYTLSPSLPSRGFAILPMVLTLTFLIATVSAVLLFLGTQEAQQSAKHRDANIAFIAAQAGITDAQMRITRDFNYATSTGYILGEAVLGADRSATVIVQKDSFAAPCTATWVDGKRCIISTATVKKSKRRIEVVVTVANNGKVTVDSFKEIAP